MTSGIEQFLRRDEEKELLRLSTAGSVDDGKSTLIGRLLYDSKGVYEDQLASVRKASVNRNAGPVDFSLLTDGLRAEREQGITIDVAYRHFATPRRKFIIADTPGHEQYTRNMATGASTADLAIILIDARNGVLPQSKRHAYIAALLGIPHVIVAVNKMDLVEFSQPVFERIRSEFAEFLGQLGVREGQFLPISALDGDNVVTRSARMPWYEGPSLLEELETAPIARNRNLDEFRFPVQLVLRPNLDFRGYAGQVASGVVRKGDPVLVLPSGRTSRVKSIATYDGELHRAFPPMAVTLCLEDEIDISRGDMLVDPRKLPHATRHVEAMAVWMHETPLEPGRTYLVKHTTQTIRGTVTGVRHRVDVNTLEKLPADGLELNEIGQITLETTRPLFFDAYSRNRATGAFILIDPLNNATVGAGMILGPDAAGREKGGARGRGKVTADEREARLGYRAATVWLDGGEELAVEVERKLFDRGVLAAVLTAGSVGLSLRETARVLNESGVVAICVAAGRDAAARDRARETVGSGRFAAVEGGALPTGLEEAAQEVCRLLEARGWIPVAAEPLTGGDGI